MAMAPLAICLSTFVFALAGAYLDNVDTVTAHALLEVGTHRHLQALMSNMTAEEALARPPSMPVELQAFVKQQLSAGSNGMMSQAFLQAHTSKSKKLADASELEFGTMDEDKARITLNKMAMDTMLKLDMQRAECLSQQAKQTQLLDETGQDMSSFNAQGTTARAQVMATQTAIKRLEEEIPKLTYELDLHEAKCKESRISLKKQIELVQKDSATLKTVSGMASCSSLLQTGLVHCHAQKGGQGISFVQFRHSALRHKAAQLKSPKNRQALQTVLLEVAVGRHRRHHHRQARHSRARRSQKQHRHRRHRHEHKLARRHQHTSHHAHKRLALLSQNTRTQTASTVNVTSSRSTKAKCSLRSSADCNALRDKLMLMQAGALDDVEGRYAQLASTEEDCKVAKKNMQDQIQSSSLRLQEQQEMLAEATTIMIDAAEQSRLKGLQLDHLNGEHKKMDSFCQETLSQAALELCKIKSIRQELYKIKQKRPFIQDCEVSAWTPEECSKPCGGGVQNLVRQVVVPDDKGASCPPLTAQRSCNTQECPVNCDMKEWSGWTSCSAKCGGGIKQRIRRINTRAQHGGNVCGPETESVSCGVSECDKDCTLAEWSRWSTCSKACGGGFEERARRVIVPSSGLGRCDADDSEYRLQYKRCNTDKCTPKKGPLLKCASKVDVILLLDGSGSLGKEGWETMKKAGADIVRAMDPDANGGNGAQVAVLLYSGPKDMDAYKKCTGEVPVGGKKVDLVMDCKMIWVSHLTTSKDTVADSIGNLFWQKGSTMTSQALASAEAELVYGRADAQQVVIALVDKLPMMPRKTGMAAESVRKKARLIFAAATPQSDVHKFAEWASRPVADNLVYMPSVADFAKPDTINKIIAAACPKVE
jgi:hypothetical protein